MSLQQVAEGIRGIAERAGSEAKLQVEVEPILKRLLAEHGISYEPAVNESLRRLGYSLVSADRPDSLFGHVVLDYKEPGRLGSAAGLAEERRKIERYLDEVTHGGHAHDPEACAAWAGVLWDGLSLTFSHSDGDRWVWSGPHETSEGSLLSLVQVYRALARLPLTARLLAQYFGKTSSAARAILPVLCRQLASPGHRTLMLFREWRRLFEQISTYQLGELPSLRAWARANDVQTRDASQILFAMHTYYSLVVKLLAVELLAGCHGQRHLRGAVARQYCKAAGEPPKASHRGLPAPLLALPVDTSHSA